MLLKIQVFWDATLSPSDTHTGSQEFTCRMLGRLFITCRGQPSTYGTGDRPYQWNLRIINFNIILQSYPIIHVYT
jgi:hypothetical protein